MSGLIEKVVSGVINNKSRWREYKRRAKALPAGDADVFGHVAAGGGPVRGVVGDDAVRFVEELMARYSMVEWIGKRRMRLVDVIARAGAENGGERS